jgi:hypothetical protein
MSVLLELDNLKHLKVKKEKEPKKIIKKILYKEVLEKDNWLKTL